MSTSHSCYADLHVHIGSAGGGLVKVTASRDLTLRNILDYVPKQKGLGVVGIVDAASPLVQQELVQLLAEGLLRPVPGGGLASRDLLLILGAELELSFPDRGSAHYLAYLPGLAEIQEFTQALRPFVTNPNLSTQSVALLPDAALRLTAEHGGFLVPAHAFTPHKGVLGACARSLQEVFPIEVEHIYGLELGLSSDTRMADAVSSLAELTFLSSSDAHSLPKIGREYMQFSLERLDFASLEAALRRHGADRLVANYGMAPVLGKYHRSFCERCGRIFTDPNPVKTCPACGDHYLVLGVWDRLQEIADQESCSPLHRPPYIYQVPLEMLPGIGPKLIERLIAAVGPEKYVLNEAGHEELIAAAGAKVATTIMAARMGRLRFLPGGGGRYGRVRLV